MCFGVSTRASPPNFETVFIPSSDSEMTCRWCAVQVMGLLLVRRSIIVWLPHPLPDIDRRLRVSDMRTASQLGQDDCMCVALISLSPSSGLWTNEFRKEL